MEELYDFISRSVADEEKALGLDWRYSYHRLTCTEEGGLLLELSRAELLGSLPVRLAGFEVESRGEAFIDLRAPSGQGVRLRLLESAEDHRLWVLASVADIRRGPSYSSELLAQSIMGEALAELRKEGDWHLVRMQDDYHGWIRSWHVREATEGELEAYGGRINARVEANIGYILSSPEREGLPVSDVVAGTLLVACEPSGGYRRVTLPGGRMGYAAEVDLCDYSPGKRPSRRRVCERAKKFMGIPYLWGGTSAKGFDCSGFVKRVFLSEGVELPRDSDRQAMMGSLIPRERAGEAKTGDLLFFGEGGAISHVAISLGAGLFIHAYGDVRINCIYEGDSRYEGKLVEKLLFVRSILPEDS